MNLAEYTAKITAREEYCTASVYTLNTRLLTKMRRCSIYDGIGAY